MAHVGSSRGDGEDWGALDGANRRRCSSASEEEEEPDGDVAALPRTRASVGRRGHGGEARGYVWAVRGGCCYGNDERRRRRAWWCCGEGARGEGRESDGVEGGPERGEQDGEAKQEVAPAAYVGALSRRQQLWGEGRKTTGGRCGLGCTVGPPGRSR